MKKENFIANFKAIRHLTEVLCSPLSIEDHVIQSMPDVSPPKWHLAHTSWFFETFILMKYHRSYTVFDPLFSYLFNSYYQALGTVWPREQRGLLARPSVETVYAYRDYINQHLLEWIDTLSDEAYKKIQTLLQLGLQHEQQHQELLLMDIKYNFYIDPHWPVYQSIVCASTVPSAMTWVNESGGETEIGHTGEAFCFDNELSRHRVILAPWEMASRLVTNEEYAEFIEAKGYENPTWWLADGWAYIQQNKVKAPLYWHRSDNEWQIFTLNGMKKLQRYEPVSHVSYYEADAYARWRGERLPTEAEWEHHAQRQTISGNFLEMKNFHPQIASSSASTQLFGDVWEWTASAYLPYPGFKTFIGEIGEYNGKFMNNQMVLRGGACVTPATHIRSSYRNFYQPEKRWAFTGIRLARNLK